MNPYVKNLGPVFLIALALNVVLSLSHAIIFQNFFMSELIFAFLVFSAGLFLFIGMSLVYTKLGGKKPITVFSIIAVIIAIMALTLRMDWHIGLLFSEQSYLVNTFYLELILPIGLMIVLSKGLKENKWVAITTGLGFVITLFYYSFFSILLKYGIFILGSS